MRLPRFTLLRYRYEGLSPSGQSVKGVRNDIIQPRREIATGVKTPRNDNNDDHRTLRRHYKKSAGVGNFPTPAELFVF